ncbi:MAG: Glycosyl hydrolase family 20, catalytic domain [Lentisphaerae bacterium ADurb.BinA184]|nr:MAG: Glycosyl hydrolase family 20, catalytic domain [Lentisphaerae bacterium ADurb.BinA184]
MQKTVVRNRVPGGVSRGLDGPWRVRAVQLDLARQMETVDYIRHYADTAAAHGFNLLALYLEARVRTPTFPFRPRAETYSLDDMARVVEHCRQLGMDVMPAVSTLGHCEQFLACPELAHLAEARDGRGRFGPAHGPGHVVCPSLDGTYAFFGAYLRELAEVFTGPNLHIGLDEAWDVGFCRLCRPRWEAEGAGALFIEHLRRIHALVCGLRKRVWLWDDLFEFFPERVADAPADVVMCHWCYDEQLEPEGAQAHFANRWRRDWLAAYAQHGIEAVVCPWDRLPRNVESLTAYARRHRLLGGLLTQWEGTPRQHAFHPVVVAMTGRLWSGRAATADEAWTAAVAELVPGASPSLTAAVRDLASVNPGLGGRLRAWLGGRPVREEWLAQELVARAAAVCAYERQAPGRPRNRFLDRVEWAAEAGRLSAQLRESVPAIYDPRRTSGQTARLRTLAAQWRRDFRLLRAAQREVFAQPEAFAYPGEGARLEAQWQVLERELAPVWRRLREPMTAADWWLILRLHLQDYHAAPVLRVSLCYGKRVEEILPPAGLKPRGLEGGRCGGVYTSFVPFRAERAPDAVRLEAWGYGGQGVAFVEAQNPTTTLLPAALRRIEGRVTRPEAVLRDDSAVAALGCPDVAAAFHRPQLAEERALIEIALAAAPVSYAETAAPRRKPAGG